MHRARDAARSAAPWSLCGALVACGGGGGDGGGGGPLNITSTTANDGVVGAAYSDTVAAIGRPGREDLQHQRRRAARGPRDERRRRHLRHARPVPPAPRASRCRSAIRRTTPATDTQALSIDIVDPLAITTAALADTSVGEQTTTRASSRPAARRRYSFTVSEGELPAGIVIGADGAFTGTVRPSATTETFTIEVADSSSPQLTASQDYTVRVALEITTTALADCVRRRRVHRHGRRPRRPAALPLVAGRGRAARGPHGPGPGRRRRSAARRMRPARRRPRT